MMRGLMVMGVVPGSLLIAGTVVEAQQEIPAGAFAPAGTLSVARSGHTATLLPSGRVLIVGGWGEDLAPLGSAEVWDPAAGSLDEAEARLEIQVGQATMLQPAADTQMPRAVWLTSD